MTGSEENLRLEFRSKFPFLEAVSSKSRNRMILTRVTDFFVRNRPYIGEARIDHRLRVMAHPLDCLWQNVENTRPLWTSRFSDCGNLDFVRENSMRSSRRICP